MQSVPNPGYKLQKGAATGGFLTDKYSDGAWAADESPVYEPSPVVAGGGWYAKFVLGYNLILHLAACIFATVGAGYHIPTGHWKGSMTEGHSVDFVASWCYVMVLAQWFSTVLTVAWYGFVFKAHSWALPGSVCLGLQLAALLSAVKLSYYLAIDDRDAGSKLKTSGEWAIVTTMYVQAFLTAGYIMTPSSGTYYKTVPDFKKPPSSG